MKKYVFALVTIMLFIITPTALAESPRIATGTIDLLDAVFTWSLILAPAVSASVMAWHAFVKYLNEGDPAQVAIRNRAMKKALVTGVIVFLIFGAGKLFLSFCGG